MRFFDDLGKKVTDAGQKTVQKTKEISEIARINSLISQAESKINSTYYQIGRQFVTIHESDCEGQFAGLVRAVADLEQSVRDYRKQIQDIKGIQNCEKCGAEVPRGVAFCSGCGAAMPKMLMTDPMEDCLICTECGTSVKKGMRFCTSCGKAMLQPQIIEMPQPEDTNTDVPLGSTEKVCPECGTKQADSTAFCMECGAKL